MKTKKCSGCGRLLDSQNTSDLCYSCQDILGIERFEGIESPFMTASELAQYFRTSVEHIRRLNRKGDLPTPISLGRLDLWDKDVIEQWKKSRYKYQPTTAAKVDAIDELHGGGHIDETTGKYIVGKKEDIQVIVASKGKRRRKAKIDIVTISHTTSEHNNKG